MEITKMRRVFTVMMFAAFVVIEFKALGIPDRAKNWPPSAIRLKGMATLEIRDKSGYKIFKHAEFDHYYLDGAILTRLKSGNDELGQITFMDARASAAWRKGTPDLGDEADMYSTGTGPFDFIAYKPLLYLARYDKLLADVEAGKASIVSDQHGTANIESIPEVINQGSNAEYEKFVAHRVEYEGNFIRSIQPFAVNRSKSGIPSSFPLGEIVLGEPLQAFPQISSRVTTRSYTSDEGRPFLAVEGIAIIQSAERIDVGHSIKTLAEKLFSKMELATPEANLTAYGLDVQKIGRGKGAITFNTSPMMFNLIKYLGFGLMFLFFIFLILSGRYNWQNDGDPLPHHHDRSEDD